MSTTGKVVKNEYEGHYVLTVSMNGGTKYMKAFDKNVNYEDALQEVLKDIQVSEPEVKQTEPTVLLKMEQHTDKYVATAKWGNVDVRIESTSQDNLLHELHKLVVEARMWHDSMNWLLCDESEIRGSLGSLFSFEREEESSPQVFVDFQ